jgi:hypothetical protein
MAADSRGARSWSGTFFICGVAVALTAAPGAAGTPSAAAIPAAISTYDHFALRSHLQSLGISLRSATEPIDDTSTGKLMEGVLAAFAQFDNDVRSDRTRAGMKAALDSVDGYSMRRSAI